MQLLNIIQALDLSVIDRDIHGAKFVGLVKLTKAIDGDSELSVPTASTVPEEVMEAPFDYRREIGEALDTIISGLEVPAMVWVRSNANIELDGVFKSVSILFDPEKPDFVYDQAMDAMQEVAKSKDSDYARQQIESFGLEGKVKLHGLLQLGARRIKQGIDRRKLLGAHGMTFYVYSHGPFNQDYVEIKFGFGLGQGIVEGHGTVVVYDRETTKSVLDLTFDNRTRSKIPSYTFTQKYGLAYDLESNTIINFSLSGIELNTTGRSRIDRGHMRDMLGTLAYLAKELSNDKAVKLEAYLPQLWELEPIQLIQLDEYDLPTRDKSYSFHDFPEKRIELYGKGITKGPINITVPLYVFHGEQGNPKEEHIAIAQGTSYLRLPPISETTRGVIENSGTISGYGRGLHELELGRQAVYEGKIGFYAQFDISNLLKLDTDDTNGRHSIYRNCNIQCNGNEARLTLL